MEINITNLTTIVSLILALSIASERLVEIVKGVCPWLNEEKTNAKKEGYRRTSLQVIALLAGIATAWLARPIIPGKVEETINGSFSLSNCGSLIAVGCLAVTAHVKT